MGKRLFLFICILCLTAPVTGATGMLPVQEGVWRQVDPGGSGGTLEFNMHPVSGTLLVSSDMGRSLLKSVDGGMTYTPVAPDGHPTIDVLVPHPEKSGIWYAGFTGVQGKGLYITSDDGQTWTLVRHTKDIADKTVAAMVIPGSLDTLVWLIEKKGIFLSRDGGTTFQNFSQGLDIQSLPKQKKNLSARTPMLSVTDGKESRLFLATTKGIFERRLSAPAWSKSPGSPDAAVLTLALDKKTGTLWAGTANDRIHGLELNTGKWNQIPAPGHPVTLLKTHPDKPGWLWCFSHGRTGLFRTKDRGRSWELLTRRLLTQNEQYQGNVPRDYRHRYKFQRDYLFIHPKNPDHIILGDMYHSRDGGVTWQFAATRHHTDTAAWEGRGLTLLTSYRAFWDTINPNRVYLGFSDTGLMLSPDRGKSVISLWSSQYPDLYDLAYWSRQMLNTSGSCMAFAADPDFPSTQFYGMSGKGGKTSVCGMLFTTTTDGRQWTPTFPDQSGLPDGIIPDMLVFPGKGYGKRELIVAVNSLEHGRFPKAGVYRSEDSGKTFVPLAESGTSPLTFPLMNLDACRDHPDTLYAAASSEGGKRPAKTLKKAVDGSLTRGGIFKSTDHGNTWKKAGGVELAGAVQVAAHPEDPQIAYAAVVQGDAKSKAESFVKQGGIYRTTDGGGSWKLVLGVNRIFADHPDKPDVTPASVAINPVMPSIVYAAVNRAGVFRTTDSGNTWQQVDWEGLKRFQGTYHSLTINPHDPPEFYLSLFGNAFLAYKDPVAADALEKDRTTLVLNGGFENLHADGRPVHWNLRNLGYPGPTDPLILSITKAPGKNGKALHIQLKGDKFNHPGLKGNKKGPVTFLSGRLAPWAMSRIRGKQVILSYDVYAKRLKTGDTPVLSMVKTGELPSRILAELPVSLAFTANTAQAETIQKGSPQAKQWKTVSTEVTVPQTAMSVSLILLASEQNQSTDLFIDNITLSQAGRHVQ
ncbi:MAG TPA: hypothetical protein DHV36_19480 [Desulfobacteraceae bacterium]|nr:hypothetical protein [Desulfobacteraceae bacterium]